MAARLVRIGTRGSPLALWQARHVAGLLAGLDPGIETELVVIKTQGDRILDVPLAKVGGKGLFIKEIEDALLERRVDLAVHSMKDVPAELPEGLMIAAIPPREDPRDALVAAGGAIDIAHLPKGGRVGTSSLRRAAQILAARPDIVIEPLRGNVETRLSKLTSMNLSAVVLAAAGLKRLGFENRITAFVPATEMLPAVGQGALALETRADDEFTSGLARRLDDPETRAAVTAERAFLSRVEGGCQVPVAAHAKVENGFISLDALIADVSGSPCFRDSVSGPVAEAASLGVTLADWLLDRGGREIMARLLA
ncbi:MAG: hydroxymethylbilane synthase [Deltaproteobacteria bacterium]|nr:hydroxymethylbilane synthase [Deltaproteobacteria bacterium]